MGESRSVDLVGSMHRLGAECCCRIPHQCHVMAEFSATAGGGLDAGIGQHSYHDDLFDAALLELEIEVGTGKSILAPMLLDHNVARLGYEFRMPLAAPEYYERCTQILHDLDEADEAVSAVQLTPRGQLQVYCHQGIGRVATVAARRHGVVADARSRTSVPFEHRGPIFIEGRGRMSRGN
jgi:hypothetical protein